MSADKYPCIFSRQMATIVYIFPIFENCARCEKDFKDNKDNSLHLGRKYARIFVLGHCLCIVAHSYPRASLSENCSLLETDNVRGQISVHIFAPNGDYCLFNLIILQLNMQHIVECFDDLKLNISFRPKLHSTLVLAHRCPYDRLQIIILLCQFLI